MSKRRLNIFIVVLCLFAFLTRVGAIVALEAWEHPGSMEHRSIAHNLLRGQGFAFTDFGYHGLSSVQSPTYPILLAGLFSVFGVDSAAAYATAMLINAAIGALTVWLTYLLARTMGACVGVSIVAAGLFAVWPTQVYTVTHAQAIVAVTAGLAAVIVLFYRSIDTGRLLPWVGFSIVGCLAALTDPALLPPMALSGLLILGWRSNLSWPMRIRNAAVLLVAALLIIGPWTLRNRMVHGIWIPVKSTFWVNVWKANNVHATGTDRLPLNTEHLRALNGKPWWRRAELIRKKDFDAQHQIEVLTQEQVDRLTGQPEVEREMVFKELAVNWIRAKPIGYLRLCGIRFVKTIWVEWDNPMARHTIYMTSRTLLIVLAMIGLLLAVRRRWRLIYPAVMVGALVMLYTVTITAARFSLPLEPVGFCLVAQAAVATYGWCRRSITVRDSTTAQVGVLEIARHNLRE